MSVRSTSGAKVWNVLTASVTDSTATTSAACCCSMKRSISRVSLSSSTTTIRRSCKRPLVFIGTSFPSFKQIATDPRLKCTKDNHINIWINPSTIRQCVSLKQEIKRGTLDPACDKWLVCHRPAEAAIVVPLGINLSDHQVALLYVVSSVKRDRLK